MALINSNLHIFTIFTLFGGGGGPFVHVYTVFNNAAVCLYYSDPRPLIK